MWRLLTLLFLLLSLSAYSDSSKEVRTKALPGTVALTFDDGPSPVYTSQVLAILKKYHVKATFFVMGWSAKKHPELIRQMIAEGHSVGSHTNSHKKLTTMPIDKLRYEISMPKAAIKAAIGRSPVCLRPPYGIGNKRVAAVINEYDMVMIPMGFNSLDLARYAIHNLLF